MEEIIDHIFLRNSHKIMISLPGMTKARICPKCKGEMKTGNYTGVVVDWEKEGEPTFLKQSGQKIVTYACIKCGYMESYVQK